MFCKAYPDNGRSEMRIQRFLDALIWFRASVYPEEHRITNRCPASGFKCFLRICDKGPESEHGAHQGIPMRRDFGTSIVDLK